MKILYFLKKGEHAPVRYKILPALILAVFIITGCLNQAVAQKGNLSDWNVPPPLPPVPPGSQLKGNAVSKAESGKVIVLTLVDVPAPSLPPAPPVQIPVLASIAATSPLVDVPNQPTISGVGAGLPDVPSPDAPETPALPKQVPGDVAIIANTEIPVPEAPEMPPFPKEPLPSGLVNGASGAIPVMPNVISPPGFSIPVGGDQNIWSTPGVQQNESFKLIKPTGSKSIKPTDKGAKKTSHNQAKTN
jgi:hypothetical protein